MNGRLYFAGDDGVRGRELWQTDGTPQGTVLVRDIYPGLNTDGKPNSSFPSSLVAMNNKLYFTADDGVHGRELWDPPAVEPPTPPTTATVIPGELLVSFRPGVTQAEIARFYADHDLAEKEALDRHARADGPRLRLVSVPAARTEALIPILERDPRVAYAEPNYLITGALQAATPTDPYYVQQTALDNFGQFSSVPDADIDATDAWKVTTGSPDVLIAVMDVGMNYTHPDLVANIWANPFETPGDGIDNDNNGYIDDIHGIDATNGSGDPFWDPAGVKGDHATNVASVIGATPFNESTAGIAWRVGIIPVQVVSDRDTLTTSDMVRAYQYVNYLKNVQGQNIVATNNSYTSGSHYSQAVRDALAALDQPGMNPILHVCGAANDGRDLDADPLYPASYDLDNIVTVAATDWNDHCADWSAFGEPGLVSTRYGATSVDLGAPGYVQVISSAGDPYGFAGFSGTSAAAPHVTGAAALVASAFPGITAAQIKARILGGVDLIGDIGDNALKPTVTNGRLNIANALAGAPTEKDNKAPAAIANLVGTPTGFQSVTLTWTATGDDGPIGRAAFYDVRYSTAPITSRTWDAAVRVLAEPAPKAAGGAESFPVTGLEPGTLYYFAVRARDNMGNQSALSNVAAATTGPARTLFADNIENGANGWSATGLWHPSALRANSPAHAWYYGDEATRTYDTGAANAGTLTSPVLDLRNATHPVLIYRELRSVEDTPLGDYASLQIGTGPNQWATVTQSSFSTAIDPLNFQDLAADLLGWSASVDTAFDTPQWVTRAADLSAYTGQTIQIRFAFDTGNPGYNVYEGWYVDDVNVFDTAPALLATVGQSGAGASHQHLRAAQAQPLLAAALERWQAAGVDTSGLGAIDVRVANLGGTTLGLASGETIWLDDNAAGWGWYVDRTPRSDSEFTRPGDQGERNRMDLLTVLIHKVGHLLDREHAAGGVMAETLAAGSRATPLTCGLPGWIVGLDGLSETSPTGERR